MANAHNSFDFEEGYSYLLREAFDARDAVDDYDLHSELPESLAEWNKILEFEKEQRKKLFDYVVKRKEAFDKGQIEDFYSSPDYLINKG